MVRSLAAGALIAALVSSTSFAQVVDAVKIGAINLSYVARSSKVGKTELARIEEVSRKKAAEIDHKAADFQKQQTELQRTGSRLSPRAAGDLQRAFEKGRLDLERFQQDARNEIEAMQTQFDVEFRAKLAPVIDEIAKEKGLHFVFGLEQAAIVWWSPAVDISDDVVKRLNAEKK